MSDLPCPVCGLDLDTVDWVELEASWHPRMGEDTGICPTCQTPIRLREEALEECLIREALEWEDAQDLARGLALPVVCIINFIVDARRWASKYAGGDATDGDRIAWDVLGELTQRALQAHVAIHRFYEYLRERMAVRQWLWLRWREDMEIARREYDAVLREHGRRGGYWLAEWLRRCEKAKAAARTAIPSGGF